MPAGLEEQALDIMLHAAVVPSQGEVAKRLGLSERSLRRRLKLEGTAFRDLLTQVRQERARTLLLDDAFQAKEIAFLLGFSDVSSLYRAVRRWSGLTLVEYRSRLRAEDQT